MQFNLTPSDANHILDLTPDPNNPVFEGLPIKQNSQGLWRLEGDPDSLQTKAYENLKKVMASMPSDYLILTGIVSKWLLLMAQDQARATAGTLFHYDGAKVTMIPAESSLTILKKLFLHA